MSKVYKLKDKLVVYLPFEVLNALKIRDGDEVDFFKHSDTSFLFAKKEDVAALLEKMQGHNVGMARQQPVTTKSDISAGELAILQKLDTVRYNDRTRAKVEAMLSQGERQILQVLLKKKSVNLFKKPGEQEFKYGIAKSIYDTYLFGKRPKGTNQQAPQQARPAGKVVEQPRVRAWEQKLGGGSAYTSLLESKGFVVVNTEADAANLSAALEESIRQGLVVGTRAFNKKFYVATRSFINRNAPVLMGSLGDRSRSVPDLSKDTGIEEDGVRAVLYIMSENGEVTELRRDLFKAA